MIYDLPVTGLAMTRSLIDVTFAMIAIKTYIMLSLNTTSVYFYTATFPFLYSAIMGSEGS